LNQALVNAATVLGEDAEQQRWYRLTTQQVEALANDLGKTPNTLTLKDVVCARPPVDGPMTPVGMELMPDDDDDDDDASATRTMSASEPQRPAGSK